MAQQIINTTFPTDSLKAGGDKINENFTELYDFKDNVGDIADYARIDQSNSFQGDITALNFNTTGAYNVNGIQISSANLSNNSDLAKIGTPNTFAEDVNIASGKRYLVNGVDINNGGLDNVQLKDQPVINTSTGNSSFAGKVSIGSGVIPYGVFNSYKLITNPSSPRDDYHIGLGGNPTEAGNVFGWLGVDQTVSGNNTNGIMRIGVRKSGIGLGNLALMHDGGNVAIGHDQPTERLDVAGSVKADNIIYNVGTDPRKAPKVWVNGFNIPALTLVAGIPKKIEGLTAQSVQDFIFVNNSLVYTGAKAYFEDNNKMYVSSSFNGANITIELAVNGVILPETRMDITIRNTPENFGTLSELLIDNGQAVEMYFTSDVNTDLTFISFQGYTKWVSDF